MLIGTKEAAERLGVSLQRIKALIKNKQLKAIKAKSIWLIEESDLQCIRKGKAGRPRIEE